MTKGYHHLTQFQRCQIATLKESGFSQTEIAKRINVHKSSVSQRAQKKHIALHTSSKLSLRQ